MFLSAKIKINTDYDRFDLLTVYPSQQKQETKQTTPITNLQHDVSI